MGGDCREPPNGRPTVFTLLEELHDLRLEWERRFAEEQKLMDERLDERFDAIRDQIADSQTALVRMVEQSAPSGSIVLSPKVALGLIFGLLFVAALALGGPQAGEALAGIFGG